MDYESTIISALQQLVTSQTKLVEDNKEILSSLEHINGNLDTISQCNNSLSVGVFFIVMLIGCVLGILFVQMWKR